MFTHNTSVLLISPNMGTRELSVNKWENKVTCVTCNAFPPNTGLWTHGSIRDQCWSGWESCSPVSARLLISSSSWPRWIFSMLHLADRRSPVSLFSFVPTVPGFFMLSAHEWLGCFSQLAPCAGTRYESDALERSFRTGRSWRSASGCLEEEEVCKEAQVACICISFVPQRVFKGLYKVRLMPSLKKQECFCTEKQWVEKTSSLTQLKMNKGDEGIFHRIQTRT